MRKQKNCHYLLFAVLSLFVSSCNLADAFDDDGGDNDDTEAEVVSAKINGVPFMAVKSGDAFVQLDEVDADLDLNGDVFEFSISAMDFGKSYLTTISLSLHGDNYSTLINGEEFVGITEESTSNGNPIGAVGVVARASVGGSTEFGGLTLASGTIHVKITKLDKENELISGEFSFVAYDEDNDSNINVTDGVFTDVEW